MTYLHVEKREATMEQKLGRTARIVQHKGVEILISDYSGLKGQELMEAMKNNTKIFAPMVTGRRDCVIVSLLNDCLLNEDTLQYTMKMQKAMDGTFVANALVGLSPIQKAAVEITGALKKLSFEHKFFDSQEEAMDWAAEVYKKFKGLIK